MLKLSGLVKKEQFEFTDVDGNTHKLEVCEYTIADVKKLIDIQQPIIAAKDMSIADQSEMIIGSRIVCAIKFQDKNDYFWNTVEDLTTKGYTNGLVNTLYPIVNKLNPIDVADTLEEKKTDS